jgi:hypothetical protein
MKNVKQRIRKRLTDEHLEGCMRIATTETEPDIDTLLKRSSVKYFNNNRFCLTNDCVTVCNNRHNFVEVFINCHGVSINCPHVQPCGPQFDKIGWIWPQVLEMKKVETLLYAFICSEAPTGRCQLYFAVGSPRGKEASLPTGEGAEWVPHSRPERGDKENNSRFFRELNLSLPAGSQSLHNIWGYHSGKNEDCDLLGCDPV